VSDSSSTTYASASSSSTRSVGAGPGVASSASVARSRLGYPWYSTPPRTDELQLFVRDDDIDVFFEEPLR